MTTDATGTFKMDRAPAGPSMVGCMGNGASGWVQATVNVGQVTRVEVAMRIGDADEDDTRSGLTLDDQLDDVYVESIEPHSPAARAGIVVDLPTAERLFGERLMVLGWGPKREP